MKRILWILLAATLLPACSDDYLVYETVAPTVYVLGEEFNDLTDTYEQSPEFTVRACRSGNSTAAFAVALVVETSALVDYNLKTGSAMQLLPATCYRIPRPAITSTADMPQFAFNVQFDVKAIRALPAGDYAQSRNERFHLGRIFIVRYQGSESPPCGPSPARRTFRIIVPVRYASH